MSKKRKNLWRGLASVSAVLMVISICATSIADDRATRINGFLGTSNVKVIRHDSDLDAGYFDSEFSSLADLVTAKQELAVAISAEGSVLLKNSGALPLSQQEKVTLWGLNSANPVLGGMIASTAAVASDGSQQQYGIGEALEARGFQLNQEMLAFYASATMDPYRMQASFFGNAVPGHALSPSFGAAYENPSQYTVGEAPASVYTDQLLASADDTVAVVVVSRDNSEAADYHPEMVSGSESDSFDRPLALSQNERAVIELAKEHSTKVIVLLNSDNPLELADLKEDAGVDAILWVGAPGVNGFLGVADILSGAANPSGRLVDTYPVNSTSAPSMVNFGLYTYANSSVTSGDLTQEDKGDWYIVESEGIYTGYKYYETRYEDCILGRGNAAAEQGSTSGGSWNYSDEVVYPFGYGLSYTTFSQTLDSVDVAIGGVGSAKVTVTNTGDVAGKDVVELYVQAPYTEGGLEKAAIQLIGFGKTSILDPGASETVTVEFDPKYMASYDESVVKEDGSTGAWVLEAGTYFFAIGNGAHEALNNVLAAKSGSSDNLETAVDSEQIDAENAFAWSLDAADMQTYSVGVENALQDCDINKLIPDTVDYTTRADWSVGWEPATGITFTEDMAAGLTNQVYTFTENGEGTTWGADHGLNLASFLLVDDEGNFAGTLDYNDPQWDMLIEQVGFDEALEYFNVNGFRAIDSIGFPQHLGKDGPVGIAYDQVAGYSVNWDDSQSSEDTYVAPDDEFAASSMAVMPTEPVVAATFNVDLAYREGELFGEDTLWSNVVCIFAPALNLHRTPYCGRNHEYYSEDAMLTNLMGTAICSGGSTKGAMMEPKHFAFNHQELNRSGVSTFFTEQAGRENELRAFQGAMESNAAKGVMTAFNRVGTTYGGAHEGLLQKIGRDEWGYIGWYVSDMVNGADYMNWRDAINVKSTVLGSETAFADSKIGPITSSDNKTMISKDTAFQLKMKEIIKQRAYAVASSNALNGMSSNSEIVYVLTWWQIALRGAIVCTAVLTVGLGALYVLAVKKARLSKEAEQ